MEVGYIHLFRDTRLKTVKIHTVTKQNYSWQQWKQ